MMHPDGFMTTEEVYAELPPKERIKRIKREYEQRKKERKEFELRQEKIEKEEINRQNEKYERWKKIKEERDFLDAKAKYKDNHWWESKDPKTIVAYQIVEPILFVEMRYFLDCMSILLDREVYLPELVLKADTLKKEVISALTKSKLGLETKLTSDEKIKKQMDFLDTFGDYCAKNGIEVKEIYPLK